MTSQIQKTIKEICRKPRSHWVGDGFHGKICIDHNFL